MLPVVFLLHIVVLLFLGRLRSQFWECNWCSRCGHIDIRRTFATLCQSRDSCYVYFCSIYKGMLEKALLIDPWRQYETFVCSCVNSWEAKGHLSFLLSVDVQTSVFQVMQHFIHCSFRHNLSCIQHRPLCYDGKINYAGDLDIHFFGGFIGSGRCQQRRHICWFEFESRVVGNFDLDLRYYLSRQWMSCSFKTNKLRVHSKPLH